MKIFKIYNIKTSELISIDFCSLDLAILGLQRQIFMAKNELNLIRSGFFNVEDGRIERCFAKMEPMNYKILEYTQTDEITACWFTDKISEI